MQSYANCDGDIDGCCFSDSDLYGYSDRCSIGNSNSDGYGDGCSIGNSNGDGNDSSYNSNANGHGDRGAHTAAYPDAETGSDSGRAYRQLLFL